MPRLTEETIRNKVFNNSLETCEYVSGYVNSHSVIKVKCIVHNLEFETNFENVRRDNRKHHICPICQKENKNFLYENNRQEVMCSYCGKAFIKSLSRLNNSKSGLHFCCREHKDLAQRIESGDSFQSMRPSHYDKVNSKTYREKAFRNNQHCCAVCGWNEDIDVLEVHHIDENRLNNDIVNLIILCPICHKKLTTHKYSLVNKKYIILNKETYG